MIERARQLAFGAATATALSLAPGPAHAFLDTEAAWNKMLQFAVRQVNAPGEFEIVLGTVTRPEEGFAQIESLSLKDGDGVWLEATNLLVDWNPSSLLRGRFDFEKLGAEDIRILRAPISRGDPPAEEAGIDFAWPRPPVSIEIETLEIERIALEGGLLPQDVEARVTGSFVDRDDIQAATLAISRIDRPGDEIALKSRIDFGSLDIDFAIEAEEKPGGLVAQMAGLPADEALTLRLDTKGTPESLPFNLYADIGQIGIAEGKGTAQWQPRLGVRFDGTVKPGEKTSGDWKRALGEAAKIEIDVAETEPGTYRIGALEISSNAFVLNGKGDVDTGGNAIDLALDWSARDLDALNAVIAPARVADLKGTARATGQLTAPKLDVDASIDDLKAGFGAARALRLEIASAPRSETGEGNAVQRFSLEARAEGLALNDPALQAALGPTPSLTGDGAFYGNENRVSLETLRIEAETLSLDGNAGYDIARGVASAALSGQARRLGPFLRAAGLAVDGAATMALKVDGLKGDSVERLFLNAQLTQLSADDPAIGAALGDEAVLDLLLAESSPGRVTVERGLFESNALRAEARGSLSIPEDDIDIALDWDVLAPDRLAPLIAPAKLGDARGAAQLSGTISEPQIAVTATAEALAFETYSAGLAEIEASGQLRKDRRAPFDIKAALRDVATGDPALDRVIGDAPQIAAKGIYDTATGLLSLDAAEAELDGAAVELSGDIHLRKQTLDVAYRLDASELAGFSKLVGEQLGGALDISGRLEGPFSLPFVTARGGGTDLRYGNYALEAVDLDIETAPEGEDGVPFRLAVDASGPRTGDADLDALLGASPRIVAKGVFDRNGPRVALEYLDARLALLTAEAAGEVDLGRERLDLSFDIDAQRLDGLSGLLGTEIAGAVKARGKARGPFLAPEIDASFSGSGLRYDTYRVGAIDGTVQAEQVAQGFAPFAVDVRAERIAIGDPQLDALLAGASTLKASGSFNQAQRRIRLDSARANAAGAELAASGAVDLGAKRLDIDYSIDAPDLAPFSRLAGNDLSGSLASKGTLSGPFALPSIDGNVSGQRFSFAPYVVGTFSGDVTTGEPVDGRIPFDLDVTAETVRTGDVKLDALLSGRTTLKARGDFRQTGQVIRLREADANLAGAAVDLSGLIDIGGKRLDVEFDLDAPDLAPYSSLAGADLDGALRASGTATGPFNIPAVDVNLSGSGLRYGAYGVGRLSGTVRTEAQRGGRLPFDIDLSAERIATGDPALDVLLGTARLSARGDADIDAQQVQLAALTADLGFARLSASGGVDAKAQTLDLSFDAKAGDLSPLSGLAGADLAGAVSAKGTARGPFAAPAVDVSLAGSDLRYAQYYVGRLDGGLRTGAQRNGRMPFDLDVSASAIATGDPKLDALLISGARLSGRGDADIAAQQVRLETLGADLGFVRLSASGNVDAKAQRLDIAYDLDAGDLSPLGGLAGEALGGALRSNGRISGGFTAPSVDATLDGQSLRYGPYSIARIDGRIAAASSTPGFAPFDVDIRASGIGTGDPALDSAVSGGASIAARGGFDRTAMRLRLDTARIDSGFATVRANGAVDLTGQSLDLSYDVSLSDLGPLSGLAGAPLTGSLSGSGTASGPFVVPAVNLRASGANLAYDGFGLGALDLDLAMPGGGGGVLPFRLNATALSPRIGDPRIEPLLGERVTLAASGRFDQTAQRLDLDSATANLAIGSADVSGGVDLAAQLLDLRYSASLPDLGPLQGIAGKPLAGAAQVSGALTGAFADPATSGMLNGTGIAYDVYRTSSLTARYDLRNLASGIAGQADLSAQTDHGPIDASARFSLAGGGPSVESFSLNGLGLEGNGALRALPGGVYEGNATLNAFELATLGAFLQQDIAGTANGTVTLSAPGGRQSAAVDLTGANLRYGQGGTPLATATTFSLAGRAEDAFGADPFLDATFNGAGAVVSGFPVQRIDATARGRLSALDVTVDGTGGVTGSERLDMVARLNLARAPRSAWVSRLNASYQGIPITIVRPLVVEEVPPGGWSLRDIDARVLDGELVGSALYSPSGIAANLRMRNLPLQLTQLSGFDLIQSGRMNGDLDIDTRGKVRGSFNLSAAILRLKGAQIDEPFDVSASGTLDGQAANVTATMTSALILQPLTAQARIPLLPRAGSPIPQPDLNAPFSAQIDWSGDVAEIWSFVPAPDHVLSGPVVINGRAGGTLASPSMTGGATLNGGQYSNLEFGTLLTDLNAQANFTNDGRITFDLSGNDGVDGRIAASGSYTLSGAVLDARLDLTNAALVRRDDLTAVISGEATARSKGRDIAIDGSFRTDFVELRLIGGFGGSFVVIDVIPVGETAPLYVPLEEDTGPGQRIALNVSLDFPNRVFVRGRGLDSEWGGRLDVSGFASDPRINGEITERRGWFDLLGRQFELTVGEVRFSGDATPYVRVRLTREANGIEGWLEVEGTGADLDISFGSIPGLPEEEVLPRLLFGRSKQSLTALEAAQLAVGIQTLLSGKAGLLDSVRGAVGVDVLRVESGDDGSTNIVTGKYVNEDIFVGAKQNLTTSETSGLVEVEIFDNFELEGEMGSTEAKGSVNWSIDY